ncbi:MAG: hypothetical protein EOM40_05420 [Clostridia bacterium]|nr:hypothetical protein [Clostridia bacterium]NCC42433.1 hypothetical protein [Clostridia bacterium]
MKNIIEKIRSGLRKFEEYLEISAQADIFYPYRSCNGFLGYYYNPINTKPNAKLLRILARDEAMIK